MKHVVFERTDTGEERTICPHCGNDAEHKRTVDVEPYGDVDIYVCTVCGQHSKG